SRFVSWFDPDTETWTLQVKFTRPEDAGRYECQVSTEPKRSHFVTLSVVVPLVVIPGGAELHVRSGSDVMLKCVISKALTPPPYVFWYHVSQNYILLD
ncbi:Lachesin, partial [Armadillidium nasatum]